MSLYAKILTLSYDSAAAAKGTALKSYWRSVRLIKEAGTVNPLADSSITNILLNGKCLDPENRNLYVFYIDTFYNASWIIEINIDTRVQTVVYYDQYNAIGFDPNYKIYNARVVHGRIVWSDGLNPIYQMDIARAKKSFYHQIGYGEYPNTEEWDATTSYNANQIVSYGNKFYKSVIDSNTGNEPKIDDGTHWTDLNCLIEDAYYSMDIKNFYFEAMPPTHPPVVTYESDNTRNINNLRQTLFQFAYRYVYMDWRKSTFSPASIVPVPQMEEAIATGLANEMKSLNNMLHIIVNSGGEEVRAIEIIARSSDDKSKWYLIETISKFKEQERGGEVSASSESSYVTVALSVMPPTVVNIEIPSVTIDSIDAIADGGEYTEIYSVFRYTNIGGDGYLLVNWLLSDDILGESVIDSGSQSVNFVTGSFGVVLAGLNYHAQGTRYLFVWIVDFGSAQRSNAFLSIAVAPPPLPTYSLYVYTPGGHYIEPIAEGNDCYLSVYNTGDNTYYGDMRCHYTYIFIDGFPEVSEWIGYAFGQNIDGNTIPTNAVSVHMSGGSPIGSVDTGHARTLTMEYFNGTNWVEFFTHTFPAV